GFDALSASKADQKKLIIDSHNALRRGVNPTASNMMKMVSCLLMTMELLPLFAFSHVSVFCAFLSTFLLSAVQCGENLFMSTAPVPWTAVTQAWYNEKKDFTYGSGAKTPGAVIGHYTQMVWHNSYLLGCAAAFCPNKTYKYFYVCHYCPAGNLLSSIKTPYKAGKPCADCPNACEKGLCS
ncbi:CRIS protein, partial [Ramphastos sulfuratus]|nr:CRIS protein [Ramphastos sulfuratus]